MVHKEAVAATPQEDHAAVKAQRNPALWRRRALLGGPIAAAGLGLLAISLGRGEETSQKSATPGHQDTETSAVAPVERFSPGVSDPCDYISLKDLATAMGVTSLPLDTPCKTVTEPDGSQSASFVFEGRDSTVLEQVRVNIADDTQPDGTSRFDQIGMSFGGEPLDINGLSSYFIPSYASTITKVTVDGKSYDIQLATPTNEGVVQDDASMADTFRDIQQKGIPYLVSALGFDIK